MCGRFASSRVFCCQVARSAGSSGTRAPGEVIDYDPNVGNPVGDLEQLLHLPRTAAEIERQPGIGQRLEVGPDLRLLEQLLDIPAPEIGKPDTDIDRILAQPDEVLAVIRMPGQQIAHLAHDNRLIPADMSRTQ